MTEKTSSYIKWVLTEAEKRMAQILKLGPHWMEFRFADELDTGAGEPEVYGLIEKKFGGWMEEALDKADEDCSADFDNSYVLAYRESVRGSIKFTAQS